MNKILNKNVEVLTAATNIQAFVCIQKPNILVVRNNNNATHPSKTRASLDQTRKNLLLLPRTIDQFMFHVQIYL